MHLLLNLHSVSLRVIKSLSHTYTFNPIYPTMISISQMRKPTCREFQCLTRGHLANTWGNQEWNPGSLFQSWCSPPSHCPALNHCCAALGWKTEQRHSQELFKHASWIFIAPLIDVCWVLFTAALFTWDFRHCAIKALLITQ